MAMRRALMSTSKRKCESSAGNYGLNIYLAKNLIKRRPERLVRQRQCLQPCAGAQSGAGHATAARHLLRQQFCALARIAPGGR